MSKDNLVALVHALSGAAALIASVTVRGQVPVPEQPIKALGYGVFAVGSLLFACALLYLRGAFARSVAPVGDKLVTGGPYRVVRHPVYLAMLIMCLGLAVGLRSWLGIVLSTIVFLTSAVWRATLEEAALSQKFGKEWKAYQRRSYFMVPFIY